MSLTFLVIRVPIDGCVHRAARVYELEGYTVSPGGDNNLWGDKGPHGAAIICTPSPGGLTQVSIVVASNPPESPDSAQRESQRLSHRMEELSRDRNWERRR
jgi:hypothetical protein